MIRLFDMRQTFAQPGSWAPWVEALVYRAVACPANLLKSMRNGVHTSFTDQRRGAGALTVSYRGYAHALARATVPAAGAGWLAEMAKTFEWVHWTILTEHGHRFRGRV